MLLLDIAIASKSRTVIFELKTIMNFIKRNLILISLEQKCNLAPVPCGPLARNKLTTDLHNTYYSTIVSSTQSERDFSHTGLIITARDLFSLQNTFQHWNLSLRLIKLESARSDQIN